MEDSFVINKDLFFFLEPLSYTTIGKCYSAIFECAFFDKSEDTALKEFISDPDYEYIVSALNIYKDSNAVY